MGKTRFNELDDKDKAFVREVNSRPLQAKDKWSLICREYGISSRSARNWITWLSEGDEEEVGLRETNRIWKHGSSDTIILTWAQNETPFHLKAWENLKKYAAFREAEIAVIQGRYRNPTSVWSLKDKKREWWLLPDGEDPDQLLMGNRITINDDVTILGDFKVRPTTANPLRRVHQVTGRKHTIIGSPRVQMESIATPAEMPTKTVWTTGAITHRNYTDSLNGKVAEFHHTYGFLILEIDEHRTHIRQVTIDDETGAFTDLFFHVNDEGVHLVDSCAAYVLGDLHAVFAEGNNLETSCKVMDHLTPETVVLHDVADAYSISHHHEKDPFLKVRKRETGQDSLKWELDVTFNLLRKYGFDQHNTYVVFSNHDHHIDRWLKETDWRKDPTNARLYFTLAQLKLEEDQYQGLGVLAALVEKEFEGRIKSLHPNKSLNLNGFELNMHGDLGSNGSRGSINQFRKLPVKTITGHSHAPGRMDGALSVGLIPDVGKLKYMMGPHNKACANVLVHNDGKAQHIFIKDGRYTNIDIDALRG